VGSESRREDDEVSRRYTGEEIRAMWAADALELAEREAEAAAARAQWEAQKPKVQHRSDTPVADFAGNAFGRVFGLVVLPFLVVLWLIDCTRPRDGPGVLNKARNLLWIAIGAVVIPTVFISVLAVPFVIPKMHPFARGFFFWFDIGVVSLCAFLAYDAISTRAERRREARAKQNLSV
jgi:hypothetical protein